ncbi:MAG: hypothetical protein K2Q25_04290 [Mycobacteriaceae bacterium]|nr:hypothetical protein [Mycobacteriaceae bacterium]
MVGPHSPKHAVGIDGPAYTGPGGRQHRHREPTYPPPPHHAAPPPATYPGLLAPPLPYPKRRHRRFLIGAAVALAVIAATTTAIVLGARNNGATTTHSVSDAAAQVAIQGYLDALEHRDVQGIVRNALCGLYDAVRDRRSDEALAKLSSDAFRKQFSQADITSIDKIIHLSQYQAQVLFTMQVVAATGGPPRDHVQGLAQLLFQRNQILVCSYVLRTAGIY